MRLLATALVLIGSTIARATVTFTDATAAAGLAFTQLPMAVPPDCLHPPVAPVVESIAIECSPDAMSGAAAAGDYDDDGFVDLFVTRPYEADILFRNKGDGSFEDKTQEAGLDTPVQSIGARWGDIDNDGDLDLYVNVIGELRNRLYVNQGDGTFTEEAVVRGAAIDTGSPHWGTGVGFGDYDRDGWLDIYTGEWEIPLPNTPTHARLLRNRGPAMPGHFEDTTIASGIAASLLVEDPNNLYAFAPAFVDLDDDGWPDLVSVSDNGHTRLFWNDGDGTFTDGTAIVPTVSDMGSTFADYDGDGDLDWFVTAISC